MSDRKYHVALFKHMQFGFITVHGNTSAELASMRQDAPSLNDYVRVSDVVEVELPPLSDDAVVAGAIKALDETRAEISREFARKLDEIDRQKADLLALTHQETA